MNRSLSLSIILVASLLLGYVLLKSPKLAEWEAKFNNWDRQEKVRSFTLPRIDDKANPQVFDFHQISLEDFGGKILVVHFWASWCQTCKKDVAILNQLQREFTGENVLILGIASYDSLDAIRSTGVLAGMDYQLAYDPEGVVAQLYRVSNLPQTIIFNPSGLVRGHIQNQLTEESVVRVRSLIQELIDDLGA